MPAVHTLAYRLAPNPQIAFLSRPCPSDALVASARALLELYKEMGVAPSKLIFRVPATWAGIQAAAALEKEGIATQVFHIYRCAQRPLGGGGVVWCAS